MKRIITGLLLVAAVIGAFFLRQQNQLFFGGFIAVIAAISIAEMAFAFKNHYGAGYFILSLITAILLWPCYLWLGVKGYIALTALVAIAAFVIMICDKSNKISLSALCYLMFVLIYPAIFYVIMLELNQNFYGMFLLVCTFLIGPASDTFAFIFGVTIKGKKLCPHVSPKKTVAGAAGALIGGICAGIVIFFAFKYLFAEFAPDSASNIFIMILMGLLGAVFTVLGDLSESAVKRRLDIKDFSNILPGHGGMLDRMDSIMFNAAFIYVFFSTVFVII